MRLTVALAVVGLALQIQQLPPRDPGLREPPPEPTGTAVISGRVVGGDSGTPIGHAVVSLVPAPPPLLLSNGAGAGNIVTTVAVGSSPLFPTQSAIATPVAMARPKTATTDSQGAFEFRDLPAGSYRLRAAPSPYEAQYLAIAFGAKRPSGVGVQDMGKSLTVSEGQALQGVTLALPRGCVIAGQVTDDNGTPLARVQIRGTLFMPSIPQGVSIGGASTDDRGQFRLFGLQPGDYVIAAQAQNGSFIPPGALTQTNEDRVGFLTTFFPGTPDEGAAQRVHVDPGAELSGIDIRMSTGRLFRVSGMVVDSQGRPARASGSLAHGTATSFMMSSGFGTDPQGRFQMQNVQPGEYHLVARQISNGAPGQPPPAGPQEMAIVPISVQDDLENVIVRLSPGATIAGQVTFDSGLPPLPAGTVTPRVTVMVSPGDAMNMFGIGNVRSVTGDADLAFTLTGLIGEYLVRGNTPGAYLKSVLLESGQDITDTPHEFKDGDHITLVMTTRTSAVQGTVTDAQGAPVTDAMITLFSEDKTGWRQNSVHTRRAGADANGQFRIMGVLPGRYLITAESRDVLGPLTDASGFEQLAKGATSLVVGDAEQRTVNLKVAAPSGGS